MFGVWTQSVVMKTAFDVSYIHIVWIDNIVDDWSNTGGM